MRLHAPRSLFLTALAVVAGAEAAGAGVLPEPEHTPQAQLATTGNNSEALKAIPISMKPGRRERVAMSLGPDELKRIDSGDRIRVNGEVQFSTTCVKPGSRCVGSHYDVNPRLAARIVLAPSPKASGPAFGLSPTTKAFCKQQRPNRNHHCTLVIPSHETTIEDAGALPCPPRECWVNMIVSAHNRKAKPANRVVLGADRPDGSVAGDKGRLNVVQARQPVPAPVASSSRDLVNERLPTTEGDRVRRRVVHSVPIPAPKRGELLSFDGSYVANITGLRFNTFLATRVILAESPTATKPAGAAKAASIHGGQASEGNGFNCTLGRSGYVNPCTVRKAGATRVKRDVVDAVSGPGTLYLNLVAAAKPLLAESKRLRGDPQVALGAGGLDVARYAR